MKDVEDALVFLDTVPQPLTLTQEQRAIVAEEISHAMKHVPNNRRDWFRKRLGLQPLNPTNNEDGQENGQGDEQERNLDGIQEGSRESSWERGQEHDQGHARENGQGGGWADTNEDGQEDHDDGIGGARAANVEDEVEGGNGNGDGNGLVNSSFFICLFIFRYLLLHVEVGWGLATGARR